MITYILTDSAKCETVSGVSCIIPFTFKGTTYNTCTMAEDDKAWCSTKVDSEGGHVGGQWGYCGEQCPIAPKGKI